VRAASSEEAEAELVEEARTEEEEKSRSKKGPSSSSVMVAAAPGRAARRRTCMMELPGSGGTREGGRPLRARDGGRGRAGRLLNGFESRSEQGAANETEQGDD
jgi:hypothetical protein